MADADADGRWSTKEAPAERECSINSDGARVRMRMRCTHVCLDCEMVPQTARRGEEEQEQEQAESRRQRRSG